MLFGQFLVMYKKESTFKRWLMEETGMKMQAAEIITQCLVDWAEYWI